VAIALGRYHTCVIANGGVVKCWGYNGNGQLGNGGTTQYYYPANVYGGRASSFFLSNSERVSGRGVRTPHCVFARVILHACVLARACFFYCVCVYCVSFCSCVYVCVRIFLIFILCPYANTHIFILSGYSSLAVALGYDHTCAILAGSGDLKCWGYNGYGQLGIGGTSTQYYPQNVDLGSATGKAKGTWYIKLSTGRARLVAC
jgi:hypothetical protein